MLNANRAPGVAAALDFEALIGAAVREILEHEDPQRFRAWLYENLPAMAGGDPLVGDPVATRALATVLGTAIWNVMPLPGNHFRPAPLPVPRRNDPCPCGSGAKFKQCCGGVGSFDTVSSELVWGFVLEAVPPESLARAAAEHALPVNVLAIHASALLDEDDPGAVVGLLAPLFAGQLGRHVGEAHALAFEVLADAYDKLHDDAEFALIDRVIAQPRRSPLRAAGWRRLAVKHMNGRRTQAAWQAFERARRDTPDSPALAHTEVLLLADDDRVDEIPARARDWVRRLRRRGFDEDDEIVDWLLRVAADPQGELERLYGPVRDGDGDALYDWLRSVCDRPLPSGWAACRVDDAPLADDQDTLRSQLRSMGVPGEQIEDALAGLADRIGSMSPAEPDDAPDTLVLVAPPGLDAMHDGWREVFPCAKPFGVSDLLAPGADPWACEVDWCEFLHAHPEAFDSIDMLDDLLSALMAHPDFGDELLDGDLYEPLLLRAGAIVERVLEGQGAPRLAWIVATNRPALRSLVRLAAHELQFGDPARALDRYERVMSLNPDDNHGLRCTLVNEYLAAGRDEDVVALCARFPGDGFAVTLFGNALALYRLRRGDEATAALASAAAELPEVARYLLRKRLPKPTGPAADDLHPGRDEEARHYWATMRPVWEASPGALAWLKGGLADLARRR